jgi:tetratricopeptide (TPR) repeat protein
LAAAVAPGDAAPPPALAGAAREVPVRPPPRDEPAAALRTALARAREQRDRGRCESALDLYGKALSIDGRNATALAGRGACYLELTRYVQAEASFEAALEVDPRNGEALYGMAETYRYMGRKAEAVAFYERFLTVRPAGDDAAAARRLISQLKE